MPAFPQHLKSHVQANIIIPVAICYILGSFFSGIIQPGAIVLRSALSAAVILGISLFLLRQSKDILLYTLPFFILLGFIHTGHALRTPDDPHHVYNLVEGKSTVTVTGKVTEMPEFKGDKTRLTIALDSLLFHGDYPEQSGWMRAKGLVKMTVEGPLADTITAGTPIMADASLYRTSQSRTPGVFDYRLYLANRSIYVNGIIRSPDAIMPYKDLGEHWYCKISTYPEQVRQRFAQFLASRVSPKQAGLYEALLVGSRAGIGDTVLENFKATGCMHLLAISGLHMGLLGVLSACSLAWIMKRSTYLLYRIHVPTAAAVLTLPLLFGYAFIAGMNTPVLRALIMSSFFLLAIVLRRRRSFLHVVAAAAILLLVMKPLALFTASFQLSFSSVLAIALIYPHLLRIFDKERKSIRSIIPTYVIAAVSVSIAATLGSLPFMLLHFNRVSTIGPLMNLLVEPLLCFWALPLGLVAFPLTSISPDLAEIFLKLGAYGINAAMKMTETAAVFPWTSLWTITPSTPEIIVYYGILAMWFYRKSHAWNNKTVLLISTGFVLYFTRGLWGFLPEPVSHVSFLDVGQGNSTFIQLPGGRKILVDGGNNATDSFDPGERIIAPFLWHTRVWQLDDIIISHPHSDHYNGLPFILSHFRPKRLWINGRHKNTWPYRDVLEEAKRLGIQIITPEQSDLTFNEGEACLALLSAPLSSKKIEREKNDLSVNDQSLIIRLRHGRHTFLFPGDISSKMENILLEAGIKVEADVLLAPHHGSIGSGSKPFLASVDPEIIVVSAGNNRQNRYPSIERLEQWLEDGRTILETSRCGTITMLTDGKNLQVNTFSQPQVAD